MQAARPLNGSLLLVFALVAAISAMTGRCQAQVSSVPDQGYFGSVEELYRGEYRDASGIAA